MSRPLAFLFFILFLAGFAFFLLKNMPATGTAKPESQVEQSTTRTDE